MHVTDNRRWLMYVRFDGFAMQMTTMNSFYSVIFLSHLFGTKVVPLKPLSLKPKVWFSNIEIS